jgi:hypothetical protein
MTSVPAGSDATVRDAVPLASRFPEPSTDDPRANWTDPVGVPACELTIAVSVTPPAPDELVRAIRVAAGTTVMEVVALALV